MNQPRSEEHRSVALTLHLPSDLVKKLDAEVLRSGKTLSQLIDEALTHNSQLPNLVEEIRALEEDIGRQRTLEKTQERGERRRLRLLEELAVRLQAKASPPGPERRYLEQLLERLGELRGLLEKCVPGALSPKAGA